jgi:hypothetical protein
MTLELRVEYKDINPLELLVVHDYLKERGTQYATILKGNDCIWVASGSASCPINEYFIFRAGKLVDIQID